jgi:hypothetical protein
MNSNVAGRIPGASMKMATTGQSPDRSGSVTAVAIGLSVVFTSKIELRVSIAANYSRLAGCGVAQGREASRSPGRAA